MEKCVMVINEALPTGLIANTAAILGITLGKQRPETVGANVADGEGREHLGIISFPVPILKGSRSEIGKLREKLFLPEYEDLTVVDFSDLAQSCKTYEEYIGRMKEEADLSYLGLAICGGKKTINKLTGSMPLLR